MFWLLGLKIGTVRSICAGEKIGYEVPSRYDDYNGGYMDLRWKRGYCRGKVRGHAVQAVWLSKDNQPHVSPRRLLTSGKEWQRMEITLLSQPEVALYYFILT